MMVVESPEEMRIVEERHERYTGGRWRHVDAFLSPDAAAREAQKRHRCGYEVRIIAYHRGAEVVGWHKGGPVKPGETPAQARERLIREASTTLIAIADDYGESLVDVIAEVERYIMERTKVGAPPDEPVPEGRRGYKIVDGRLHEQ